MATIEIIELENEQIQNKLCSMKFTKIYVATGATNIKHVWNTITFAGNLTPVNGAQSVCETGQCEQRMLDEGECVIYKDPTTNTQKQGTVIQIGAGEKYTINVKNFAAENDIFQAEHGSNIRETLYKLQQNAILNVPRVKLKTANHLVKIKENGNQKIYYTDFLDTGALIRNQIVSKTVFIDLGVQTYLPFWCEPDNGFIAVPDKAQAQQPQEPVQLAWTHYMDWCRDLHLHIETPDEAYAAYMYTYIKLCPNNVQTWCQPNAVYINVEQNKILKILATIKPSVPNPPMLYMRRMQYNMLQNVNKTFYQIHDKEETQRFIQAAKTVTQRILENQYFPFVHANNTQFDPIANFDAWLQRSSNKILVLTDNETQFLSNGFTEQNSNVKNLTYKVFSKGSKLLYVANIFNTEACKQTLVLSEDWWEDKNFYYVNYGNNYDNYKGIKPFVKSDGCGLNPTGVNIRRGGDDLQTGGLKDTNTLCIDLTYKYVSFDPTIGTDETPFEWYVFKTGENVVKAKLTGKVLQQICKDAHNAIAEKYGIDQTNEELLYAELLPRFSFIFIERNNNTTIGIKNFINNLLKINETKLKKTYDDFATNIIIMSPKQVFPKTPITENNYTSFYDVYWGYLNIKRMETNETGVVFVPPFPNSSPHSIVLENNSMLGGSGKPTRTVDDNPCLKRLTFKEISEFKQFLRCLETVKKTDYKDITPIKDLNPEQLTSNDLSVIYKNLKPLDKKSFYETLNYNINFLFKPFIDKDYTNININFPKLKNFNFNFNKSNLTKLNLTIMKSFVKQAIKFLEKMPTQAEPEPEPEPEDLSQLIHFQITFSVCKLNPNKTVVSKPFATNANRTISSTDETCYHKAYIKSVLPINIDNNKKTECQKIMKNVENIYNATTALYVYKNNGYRLVKLVDGREHEYFNERQSGFKRQALNKVVEYALGETPEIASGIPAEDIIETSELINSIGYADGLDVAFLASNPDATDMENMAMLRNGINYNQ